MSTRILFSTQGTGLGTFTKASGVYRKDFIREGTFIIRNGKLKFSVDANRIKKWEKHFQLFRERGISVPLTVDHIQVTQDGKPLLRKLTPGMAEAKRGDVVNMFRDDSGRGMFDVTPSDADAEALMMRCPEVSLELDRDYIDAHGNHYDEAITAITLTAKPEIPGQIMEWEQVGGTTAAIAACRDPRDEGREVLCLSAEPYVESNQESDMASMSPSLLARARAALKMHNDPEDEVHSKMVDHMEHCSRGSSYLSREEADKAIADAVTAATTKAVAETTEKLAKESSDKVLSLSKELEQAKTGTRMLTIAELAKDVDEDALEMAAGAIKTRIDALGAKATPAQKKMLMSKLVGEEGKRNVLALSKKTATKVGLDGILSDMVLSIFEAGDPVEMAKLLKEESGHQRTVLSRETNPEGTPSECDAATTQKMIDNANGRVAATLVL